MSDVIYLSSPLSVHMADDWFKLATLDHFWIKRRFKVFRRLIQGLRIEGFTVGEIGCGHGLVQKQLADAYGLKVDGFDLNEVGLRSSVATTQPRYCYNILDRLPRFAESYDFLVLFDVLEHIEEEETFLEAVLFHLKPGGYLAINVPALMSLYSRYDEVVGHQRRYTTRTLDAVCSHVGLQKAAGTYWGMPFIPLLIVRKLWLKLQPAEERVTRRGYKPPGELGNKALMALGALERIPQRMLGTSLLAVYRKDGAA
jgi:SAM-dependent methyltransferase